MTENQEYVQKGFRLLHPAMAKYVVQEMSREYGDEWRRKVLDLLEEQARNLSLEDDFANSLDVACCIRLLDRQWGDLFRKRLARNRRSWANELMGVRNDVSDLDTKDYPKEDAERALDTMARLCDDFDQEKANEIRSLLRELRYGSSEGSMAGTETEVAPTQATSRSSDVSKIANATQLPSWREIIEPHPDVAQGRYKNAEFAANLAEVARGSGSYEYRDPVEFFARTYITEGIKGLLVQAAKRLSGRDGEPVLQLKTAFGGGKTHSLLALYHMARGGVELNQLPNLREVLNQAGFKQTPNAKVAVVVGTAIDPAKSRRPNNLPGVTVNTLWGEIAAQLAVAANDPKLYDYVKESDKKGTSPGSAALRELFDACGPCLVLMDELVAYAKKIYGVKGLPAGSFDNFISFVQEITEAASSCKNSMVVASIPESTIEIGEDEGGERALEAIEHTFGRMESIWKPVGASEGFEVVRRRLFLDCKKPEERARICEAFSRMYQDNQSDFPIEAREVEYKNRMVSCYPIHPEIFERLYEDWATLERFQRTRGVLRLMAAVIHELWMNNDAGAMIMPGSLPLDVSVVRDELIRYLPETWNTIVDKEVDGKKAKPFELDKNNIRYGKKSAARRVSRTIMLGSAPTVRGQSIRGIEASRVRLGVIQPGENIADFNDALNTLRGSLNYLYSEAGRYYYDTRPTLRKMAQDRASQKGNSDIEYEIEQRLKNLKKEAPFAGLHVCPTSSSDVPDEQAARLVILCPSDSYNSGKTDCRALTKAEEILNNRGASPRTYRNMLAFVAPDEALLNDLKKAVAEFLAWESIKKDSVTLNLDAAQNAETAASIARANDAVNLRIKETYCRLLVPRIERDDMRVVQWDVEKLNGADSIVSKAATKMKQNEQIITKWAPALLKMELDNLLWKDKAHIQIKELWDYLTTYCYLPRLANFSVLESAVREGVAEKESFALASSFDGERYANLKYNEAVLSVHPSDYLVKVSEALKQLYQDAKSSPEQVSDGPSSNASPQDKPQEEESVGGGAGTSGSKTPIPPVKDTRFFMSVPLDNTRVIRDLRTYLDEVISHLTATDHCDVKLSLEVDARAKDGFSQETVRTVSENCRTLRIDNFGFEK